MHLLRLALLPPLLAGIAGLGCGLFAAGGGDCVSRDDCPAGFDCEAQRCVPLPDAGVITGDAGMDAAVVMDGALPADGSLPDGAMPDGAMPDGAMPDGAMSDAAMPDGARPDGASPDASFPTAPALFAVHPAIATAGETIYLEGYFPAGPIQVIFASQNRDLVLASDRNRLEVVVPQGAGNDPVWVSASGQGSGAVPFRYTTFKPRLGYFSAHHTQTLAGRELPRLLSPWLEGAAVARGKHLHLVSGVVEGEAASVIDQARLYADGTLAPFERTSLTLSARRELAALATIGDRLLVIGGEDNGADDDRQMTSIEAAIFDGAGALGAFSSEQAALRVPREGAVALVVGANLFVIGGRRCDDHQTCQVATIERARILPDGSIDDFELYSSQLNLARDRFTAAVVGDFLYVFGGTQANESVERAEISSTGELGPFIEQPDMDQPRRAQGILTLPSQLCLLGGEDGSDEIASVQCAEVNSDDSLEPFQDHGALTTPRAYFGTALVGNHLLVIGGTDPSDDPRDTIELAPVHHGAVPGSFFHDSTTPLPSARRFPACVVLGDQLLVTGGYSGDQAMTQVLGLRSEIVRAPIDADGRLGAFSALAGVTLDRRRALHRLVLAGGQLYVVGGETDGFSAPVHTNLVASSAVFDHQSLGAFTSSVDMPASRSGFIAAVANDRLFVAGGMGTGAGSAHSIALPIGAGATWSLAGTLNDDERRQLSAGAVLGGALHAVGGYSSAPTALATIAAAAFNGPSLDPFALVAPTLGDARIDPMLLVTGGSLYVLGGRVVGGDAMTGERIPLAADGSLLGSVEDLGVVLPTASRRSGCLVELGNYVHLVGGWDGTNDSAAHYVAELQTP